MHAMPQDTNYDRFQRIFLTMGLLAVATFAVAVALGMILFRSEARTQILNRDGILLQDVANYLYSHSERTGIPEVDLLELAFASSELRGVMGVRVFQPPNLLIEQVPDSLYPASLSSADQIQLSLGRPVTRFFKALPLDTLFEDGEVSGPASGVPVLEVQVPVRDSGETGIAVLQYWLDAEGVAEEFGALDRMIISMGVLFVMGGGIVFLVVFSVARGRLLKMARLLREQNISLQRANADLRLAARTSVIGSIASHLFHDLKNPLAGLKTYLRVSSGNEEAVEVTERMQKLVDDTLSVIRDESATADPLVDLQTMADSCDETFMPLAMARQGRVSVSCGGMGALPLRTFQISRLILQNLIENGLEAAPADPWVEVRLEGSQKGIEMVIRDGGSGLPEHVWSHIFQPVESAKSRGTGIGLAISAMLSRQIGGELRLRETGPDGTTFSLIIPI